MRPRLSTTSKASLSLQSSLRGHKGVVWSVSWSPRGLLASCGADRSVRVWALAHPPVPSLPSGAETNSPEGTSEAQPRWTCVAELSGQTFLRTVRDVAWGIDGRSLAAACFDATATVLELVGGKNPILEPAVSLEGHESELKGVAYSSSGGLLATCSRDRSVWIWEVGLEFDYECIAVLNGHTADVKCVAWDPRKEVLVSGSYDGDVRVWVEDEDDWFCSETLSAHEGTVWSVAFERGGGRGMASAGEGGELVVWGRREPHATAVGEEARFQVVAHLSDVHAGNIMDIDWGVGAVGKNLLATCGDDDCLRILRRQDMGGSGVEDVGAESSDMNALVSGDSSTAPPRSADCANSKGAGSPGVEDARTSSVVEQGVEDKGEANEAGEDAREDVAGGPGGGKLRTETDQGWVVDVVVERAHSGCVNSVAWNPVDDKMLASCGDDGLVRIWTFHAGENVEREVE